MKLQSKQLYNLIPILVITVLLTSCEINKKNKAQKIWNYKTEIILEDFESNFKSENISTEEANFEIISEESSHGKQALKIDFYKDRKTTSVALKPKNPWITEPGKKYCLVFDAKSAGSYSVFVTVNVFNGNKQSSNRIVNVNPEEFNSYFFELTTHDDDINSGMRDNPPAWETDAVHMTVNGLLYKINYKQISEIKFEKRQGYKDKSIIVDNIRLVESPDRDPNYLKGIVDKFGQNAKKDFPIKVYTDKELKLKADEELKKLSEYTLMADRSQYGGWKDGPKLEATGFFRTEKINGKWALVDPDGYLFFSIGLANVRMANSTTYTGIDYTDENLKYRDPEDVTPEDSKGIIEVPKEIMKTGHVINKLRHDMFLELPAYDDSLANHYSYRKESHFGPIEHGQTFSFYRANLERRYGEEYPNSFFDKWVEVTENRFRNWGFTSFGNWIDPVFYDRNALPYFANGWIIGDFQKIYSGSDYWGPMPDPFDPEFERRAKKSISTVAKEVKNNPWCIGVFIDNERSWGKEGTVVQHYGLVLDGLSKDNKSYLKKEYVKILRNKYKTIETLNKAWQTNISSWTTLEAGIDYKSKTEFSDEMVADFSILLETFATKYFKIIHDALEEKMPNHMYLGCRFAAWGVTPEVRKSAAKFVDVFSYNHYKEGIGKKYWKFLEEVDMPTLIGEFHMGAPDSGLFHSGLVQAKDQEDRANMFMDYAYSAIDNPYFVGVHWFQYLDSPISGRAHDGENYNVGFVSNTDIPYPEMVKAAKEINSSLYSRRFGELNNKSDKNE